MQKRRLTFLITAGPTIEDIDPVRFLGNHSSGKMGYALAKAAKRAGHKVLLISGPTDLEPPAGCTFIPVRSARTMLKAALKFASQADIIIKAAAVADYRPQKTQTQKIKKTATRLTLKLVKNPDILKTLGKRKKSTQLLVGFAAETNDIISNAIQKIANKNLDWIAVNDVSRKDIGFSAGENEITLISRAGNLCHLPKQAKTKLASQMIRLFVMSWQNKQ